ncbi:MAG: hypothetical protein V1845_03780 [bacterium]
MKGGQKMKVKAIYRDPNPKLNPFTPRTTRPIIRADVPDGTPKEEIEKMAKDATPAGLKFVKVVKEDNMGRESDIS